MLPEVADNLQPVGFDVITAVAIRHSVVWDIKDYTALYPRSHNSSAFSQTLLSYIIKMEACCLSCSAAAAKVSATSGSTANSPQNISSGGMVNVTKSARKKNIEASKLKCCNCEARRPRNYRGCTSAAQEHQRTKSSFMPRVRTGNGVGFTLAYATASAAAEIQHYSDKAVDTAAN
jgi:hypothetical protein